MGRYRQLHELADFQRALTNKYGVGEGTNYKPWLRVQDVPSKGSSAKIYGIKVNRDHHLLSEHESCFFYMAEFCDSVVDIREQFPLLPLDLSIKIAKALGLKHPVVPKSKTPNVMTTDFVLTRFSENRTWYEAVSVKPVENLTDKRTAEKLDIERNWWQLQGVAFHIFVMTKQNLIQSKNIQWVTAPIRQGRTFPVDILESALASISSGTLLIENLCDGFVREFQIEHDDALILLKALIAAKMITVDLNKPMADTGIIEVLAVSDISEARYRAS